MPEGDTIHAHAAALQPLLLGRPLVEVTTRGGVSHPRLVGRRAQRVEAVGKHLLIALDDGTVIRVHLRMKGQWHRVAPGEALPGGEGAATLVLVTAEDRLLCTRAQDVELTTEAGARARLAQLGPDLTAAPPDLDALVARARAADPHRSVAELLLDQRVAAGIGNVYKSELLFLLRVHPWTATAAVPDDALRGLFACAAELLRANARPGPRTTTVDRDAHAGALPPGVPRLYVYERARRPCLRCAAPISARRQGDDARITYWCPGCQPG